MVVRAGVSSQSHVSELRRRARARAERRPCSRLIRCPSASAERTRWRASWSPRPVRSFVAALEAAAREDGEARPLWRWRRAAVSRARAATHDGGAVAAVRAPPSRPRSRGCRGGRNGRGGRGAELCTSRRGAAAGESVMANRDVIVGAAVIASPARTHAPARAHAWAADRQTVSLLRGW